MRRPTRLAPLLPALLCLGLGSPAASAEEPAPGAPPAIYKWVDANGVAHYTTDLGRVPRSVRGSVRALGGGAAAETEAETDVANTPPPEAPPSPDVKPAEPLPEWDVGDAPPSSSAARPMPPPPPRATGKDRWAEIDRPVDGVTGEPVPAAETAAEPGAEPAEPGAEPAEPGAAPTQTASAEPVAPAESTADRESQRVDLDARIATLQQEIAADEDALKVFLAVTTPKDPAEIAYDSSFREVAERLPKRLAELRSLQSERAQLDSQ